MNIVVKKHRFCYGHRIYGHPGKCLSPHGHNAVISFEFASETLDELGMVIDFGLIKETACKWVDERFDHKFLVFRDDPLAETLRDFPGIVELDFNPTVENLCRYIFEKIGASNLRSITISESEENYATFPN